MKKGVLIAGAVALAAVVVAGVLYTEQFNLPWNKNKAKETAANYITQKYDLKLEPTSVSGSSNAWVDGAPYLVYFKDEAGVDFTVKVDRKISSCWDNYPTQCFVSEMEGRYAELDSIWGEKATVTVDYVNIDNEKYPDVSFADGSVDYDDLENNCRYSIVVRLVDSSDAAQNFESIYETIEYLKANECNATELLIFTKDGDSVKHNKFTLSDEYPDVESVKTAVA